MEEYIRKTDRAQGVTSWGLILRFIDTYYKDTGLSPSYKEMRDAMKVASTSTIAHHVEFLLARGMLSRIPKSPRTLLITDKGREVLDR